MESKHTLPQKYILLLILIASFFLFSYNRVDPDLWGHITFGEQTYQHRTLVTQDRYSYAPTNTVWINHEWLAEIIFYLLYNYFGAAGLLVYKIALGLLMTCMLWNITVSRLRHPAEVAPILFLLALSVVVFGFATRPQITTYLLFTVLLYSLHRFREGRKTLLVLFPIVMVLWVNLHGGFLVGIGVLALYIITEWIIRLFSSHGNTQPNLNATQLKTLTAVLCACLLATLVNPYSFRLWSFLYTALTQSRPYIWEWFPPRLDFLLLTAGIYYTVLVFITVILVCFSRPKIPLSELAVLIATLLLSLKHIRHVPLFGIVAAITLPPYLEHYITARKKEMIRRLRKITVIFLCIVNAALLYEAIAKKGKDFFRIEVEGAYYPIWEVQVMKENNLTGNLLADFEWGQYCIWKLSPQCNVFIDGRYRTVYPPEVIDEYFQFVYGNTEQEFLDKYPHDWILIKKSLPVVKKLTTHRDWTVVFNVEGSPAILLVKKHSLHHRKLLDALKAGTFIYPRRQGRNFFP